MSNFCDTLCCYGEHPCKYPGEYSINYSQYHKVCQSHLSQTAAQPSITCPYCNCDCRVIKKIILSNSPACEQPSIGVESAGLDNKIQPSNTKLTCQTCFRLTKKSEIRKCTHYYCQFCRQKCLICHKICVVCRIKYAVIGNSKCGHSLCQNCLLSKNCKACKGFVICNRCEINEVITEDSSICSKCCKMDEKKNKAESNISKPLIKNPNSVNKNKAKLINELKKGKKLKIKNVLPIELKRCATSLKRISFRISGEENCANCNEKSQKLANYPCGHQSCVRCIQNMPCWKCKVGQDKSICSGCSHERFLCKKTVINENNCEHLMCFPCIHMNYSCSTCDKIRSKGKS